MNLLSTLKSFKGKRILLIGEAALDKHLRGPVHRLNREAPVPIVDVVDEGHAPGCAANTAVNIARLGAHVSFVSVIGDDEEGRALKRLLDESGVRENLLIIDKKRRTLSKQRVFGKDHMYVRFDLGTTTDVEDVSLVLSPIIERLPTMDGVLVSDYGYGILTEEIIHSLRKHLRSPRIPLLVDSKHLDRYRSLSPTAVKPNFQEAAALAGITRPAFGKRKEQIVKNADTLFARTGARVVAVTLDAEGAVILEKGRGPILLSTPALENSKAIGAGDTFSSAFLLSLVSGLSASEAGRVALAASEIVVRKDGTASASNEELIFYFSSRSKEVSLDGLFPLCGGYRRAGKKIVFTNGCFDILHSGHVEYLAAARAQGDVLIVGVNDDAGVRRLKGEMRPINTLADRMRVLCALSCVDHVVPFSENTPQSLIETIRPDIYVKGKDYTMEELPEAKTVLDQGGEVRLVRFIPGKSTSAIVRRIRAGSEA